MKSLPPRSRGFTILEMALTLFSIGFLLSAVPSLLSQGTTAMASSPGAQPLEATELALKTFVLKNYRLPCPADTALGGIENCGSSKGFVPWKSLGLAQPATNSGGHGFAYAILRGANDLGSASAKYTPTYLDSSNSYWDAPGTLTSAQINGLDFCAKLRSQSALPLDPALLRVRDWSLRGDLTKAGNVAWVMVDPGRMDPAFNGDNHPASSSAFESPGRAQAPDYDDKVVTGSLTQMFAELRCPALLSAVSAAAREADFSNENWRVRKYLYDFRSYELDVRKQKKKQADNFLILAAFDVSLAAVLGVLDVGIALAGVAAAGTIAVNLINAVTSISMAAINLNNAVNGQSDAADEVSEGEVRKTDAASAVTAATAFRTERRAAVQLLDQRGWFQ